MNPNFDKEMYKFLKQGAKDHGTVVDQDPSTGITIAYSPSFPGGDCIMLEVAVAYCSQDDVFSKKHGKFTALSKLYHGEFIKLPLAQQYFEDGEEEMSEFLLEMFDV